MDDKTFCERMPKTEGRPIHAHFSGSILPKTLHEIWKDEKEKDPDCDLEDPIEKFERGHKDMDPKRFFKSFSEYIYRLCNTRARIEICLRSVLADFAHDGVEYLELRSIPRPVNDTSKEGYVQTVLEVLNNTTISPRPARAYLILSVDRKDSPEDALDTVNLAIKYKSQGVIGVDLAGNHTKSIVTHFHDAYKKARDAGLKITLHFAEGEFSSREEELRALLEYQPDRLGHLINVPPWAKDVIKERKIGLELCLTSNVAMGLTPSGYASHHFSEWWKTKACPIAICTDDVGIFRSTVSQEYSILMKHWCNKKDIIELSRSAVDCTFGSKEDKEMMRKLLDDFNEAYEWHSWRHLWFELVRRLNRIRLAMGLSCLLWLKNVVGLFGLLELCALEQA